MTFAEFRAFQDAHPGEKWQLIEGSLYAMAGGAIRHARIISSLAFALHRRLQGGACEVFIAHANVVHEETYFSSYPDVLVRWGAPPLDLEREITDPTACFEVLSPSTKRLDRGGKLLAYHQTPSLRHAVLVFAEEVRIEAWTRVEGGEPNAFLETVLRRRGDLLDLEALGVSIPLEEIYAGVTFPGETP